VLLQLGTVTSKVTTDIPKWTVNLVIYQHLQRLVSAYVHCLKDVIEKGLTREDHIMGGFQMIIEF
jgi:hypothetical protein